MRQIDRHADAVFSHDNFVSPYLLRRLRSYKEVVRQRGLQTPLGKRPQAAQSATLDATGSRETTLSRSGR